ncbi:hypothetical protein BU26DRAFT_142890 [Trematosphaeria pertusa]|uniref:Extensin domain-containing protein n=1 Tax=Trematosphaeria pertusa TaxID=390896 RepID=A0A6A6IW76_9PLEO|nr:uncharacterized protein BU26DRAFT_142890 [Trematosphaeria pertusa]KAF2254654.1 hypothetical protein BU26DRAFT_142890 [Trematosphaeria pertusa]
MAQNEHKHVGTHGAQENRAIFNLPTNMGPATSSEEDVLADVDEPPDLERTPRPSGLKLHESFKTSFSKANPCSGRKESLLTSALHSSNTSPVEEHPDHTSLSRGMSCASTWSNNSTSTAELTSDGDFTSPGTRTSTPSPPLPPSSFHAIMPIFNKKPFEQPVSIVRHDDENIGPLQKPPPAPSSGEQSVEVSLGRKRCITFACGPKKEQKPASEAAKPASPSEQTTEPPKRACTIKFACPTKISTDAPSRGTKPRPTRAGSPAPQLYRSRASPKASYKAHRDSDSTVRNPSPVSVRKAPAVDRSRRLSQNSDLARSEAYRFHEFASSEEEVEEWTQESTCHRRPLTVKDTLCIENNLRKLGEEAEEEALDDEEEEDLEEGDDDDVELDEDDDEDDDDLNEEEDSDAQDDVSSDEGFQTDDEEGFAVSDDDSDAGSDYNWWAPGRSTAATSIEHLEHIRPASRRSISESSVGSVGSGIRYQPEKATKRRKSRPVNIRVPSPELPDSTDFVCGTLDEDRPLEDAYLSALERRRAAKHKTTPQDIDPTFPTSDPELDEEDEDEEPDNLASESDSYFMMHGQMDPDGDLRGRRKSATKTHSPQLSPKRLRSPPPTKRTVHRSPPPRKLFGQSPKRLCSPAPVRLRSPPPTRRGSSDLLSPRRPGLRIHFAGLAERPILTTSSSLPRTPISTHPPAYDDEDTPNELPVRRAIDIKVGLEKKRQRRKEHLYKKMHRKGTKDKRPPPGKGCEKMREMGLGLAAHKGKAAGFGFGFQLPATPDQKDMHVLSV